ncbi:hypothetical protein GCM10017567_65150 [Amycolatopsis bullii]|uniref:Uncharacterized protein n=1 Tax=Amycolatopsis bullii TaxID=941987 RepID=A0ABQ3KPE5_9PSEU|nr:hypothetical protein GCM10017567_65150 [Amycolatopsis bullii]
MGNINGVPLGTQPGPQRLGQPPFIFHEQDPHRATMPHPTSHNRNPTTTTTRTPSPSRGHQAAAELEAEQEAPWGSGGLGPPGDTTKST